MWSPQKDNGERWVRIQYLQGAATKAVISKLVTSAARTLITSKAMSIDSSWGHDAVGMS